MFIVLLNINATPEEIASYSDAHSQFLHGGFQDELFLMSGPRVPFEGSVILATANNVQQLEAKMKQEPFYKHGLADYQIIDFVPSMITPGIYANQAIAA